MSAVEKYRDASKWVIGVFAAIGTLLAGAAPLAGIGRFDSARFWAVLIGGLLGLAGATAAIGANVSILVPRSVFPHELKARKQGWLRRRYVGLGSLENDLAQHPEYLLPPGITSPEALFQAIDNVRKRAVEMSALAAKATNEPQKKRYTEANESWLAHLRTYKAVLSQLLAIARFEKARTSFNTSILVMVVGGVMVGAGLGLLLYGLEDTTSAKKARAEAGKVAAEADKVTAEAEQIRAAVQKAEAELDRSEAEKDKLFAEADKIEAEADKTRAEAARTEAEANRTRAEAEKTRAEARQILVDLGR